MVQVWALRPGQSGRVHQRCWPKEPAQPGKESAQPGKESAQPGKESAQPGPAYRTRAARPKSCVGPTGLACFARRERVQALAVVRGQRLRSKARCHKREQGRGPGGTASIPSNSRGIMVDAGLRIPAVAELPEGWIRSILQLDQNRLVVGGLHLLIVDNALQAGCKVLSDEHEVAAVR
jgi:hypothetical protein